jgi:hypothetical protein
VTGLDAPISGSANWVPGRLCGGLSRGENQTEPERDGDDPVVAPPLAREGQVTFALPCIPSRSFHPGGGGGAKTTQPGEGDGMVPFGTTGGVERVDRQHLVGVRAADRQVVGRHGVPTPPLTVSLQMNPTMTLSELA